LSDNAPGVAKWGYISWVCGKYPNTMDQTFAFGRNNDVLTRTHPAMRQGIGV
jgi:hypothetical protein